MLNYRLPIYWVFITFVCLFLSGCTLRIKSGEPKLFIGITRILVDELQGQDPGVSYVGSTNFGVAVEDSNLVVGISKLREYSIDGGSVLVAEIENDLTAEIFVAAAKEAGVSVVYLVK
ncbi:hypothetical protein IEN85_04765 [Pelagicoccus sp. NFK12]|uniref:Lipoprotein n=1 Tax=Pelagicoccus enzymogenes TaxID=2773457 RepID=A0A927F5X6_9BACT|nr:hypothetical protein [Pelagicoccus enzymogenes]MBD5778792.1 hypothetical protein [Pelagicoccus enzymogenes]